MEILQIPVRNESPSYFFSIILEQKLYVLKFRFNTRQNLWSMDICNEKKEPIFAGIPLLVNLFLTQNLVSNLSPPGSFLIVDEAGRKRNPDRFSLGVDHKLIYLESK